MIDCPGHEDIFIDVICGRSNRSCDHIVLGSLAFPWNGAWAHSRPDFFIAKYEISVKRQALKLDKHHIFLLKNFCDNMIVKRTYRATPRDAVLTLGGVVC